MKIIKILSALSSITMVMALLSCGKVSNSNDEPLTSQDAPLTKTDTYLVEPEGLANATDNNAEWLSYNRTYDGQRHSPLTQVNTENVSQLGLAWYADMDTRRGQEATPLVIDGKIFVTTAWSKVKAFDARTGALIWEYDPEVPGAAAVRGCCDVVNRGLAAAGTKLFLGTFDGRLVALDRESGEPIWTVNTVDQSKPYTITGAPLVVKDKVIIGNGGAEMGVRGYISAYDVETGEQAWRFYTVPDNPENGKQAEHLEAALDTWNGEWWDLGGGGTVWDSIVYDQELDLLYFGTGNGSPWNQSIRSPGGGDNLYLSSIVAIKPDTGKYVWHYQTTPAETWDYTATQHMILADVLVEGSVRKVLMQAPKNGFFYVLDRATGEFISAKNFVPVSWAFGIDESGRPIPNPDARYDQTGKMALVSPGPSGAHSWHPMSYDAARNTVFIPAVIGSFPYVPDKQFKKAAQGYNVGADFGAIAMPANKAVQKQAKAASNGALIAWDPVNQKARWQVDYEMGGNGGVLSTASGLLFQGTIGGEFRAYNSDSGDLLWSFPTQTSVMAPPVTYEIDGAQYVAVMVGRGGIIPSVLGVLAREHGPFRNISRLLVFKLHGNKTLPAEAELNEMPLDPPKVTGTKEQIDSGAHAYGRFCSICHGDAAVGGGVNPDLRRSAMIFSAEAWKSVVYDGILEERGMSGWSNVLDEDEVESIRHYIIHRANEDKTLGLKH